MAVLDHLGISQAAVLGEMDGSTPAIMLAVEHPERVSKLVIVNGSATGHRDDDHPFGLDPAAVESTAQMVFEWWGTGRVLATVAPGLADNADFAARFERLSARPRGAAAMFRRFAEYDVRDLLSLVRVPTLVIHSDDVPTVEVGRARYLADHILESRLLETTATSWYWGGGAMEEVVSFVTGAETAGDRDLATVLFTDVVSSTQTAVRSGDARWGQTLNFLDDLVTARVEACRGRLVKQTGDGHLAEFGRPGDAVSAALGILEGVAVLGVDLRLGVHTGEIERREGGDISGLAVHIAARVAALAQPNEVLVSRTVADLIAGSGIEFTDRGECELKGVPGTWKLFAVRG
jgi:class 3 adenylate cyclase